MHQTSNVMQENGHVLSTLTIVTITYHYDHLHFLAHLKEPYTPTYSKYVTL